MPLYLLFAFAAVQGLTEFLPVSSTGHLQLLWAWAERSGEPVPAPLAMLGFEIAAHLGTLAAVVLYCARDLGRLTADVWTAVRRRKPNPGARFVVFLILATVPLFLAGWLLRDLIAEHTRGSLVVVAWANLVFAVLLLLADRFSLRVRRAEHLTVVDALVVGVFQALALVPGTSRAGAGDYGSAAPFMRAARGGADLAPALHPRHSRGRGGPRFWRARALPPPHRWRFSPLSASPPPSRRSLF